MKGEILDVTWDANGKAVVSIAVNENWETLEKLQKFCDNKETVNVEIRKWFEKRSLDANAYCWVLCDKIAKELSNESIVTKEQVYQDAILQVGTFEPLIIQEKNFNKIKRIWEKQGLGFIVQEVSRKDKCVRVNCYYGSSTYDIKEMWRLIQVLVDLAQSIGVETKTEAELKSLIESWC